MLLPLHWTTQHRGHSRGPSSSWIGTKLHNDPPLAQMSGWMLQCFMGVTLKASMGQGLFFARNRRAELKAPVQQPSSHCIGTKLHRDPPLDQTNGRMPQCLTEITLKVSLGQGLSFFVEPRIKQSQGHPKWSCSGWIGTKLHRGPPLDHPGGLTCLTFSHAAH